MPTTKTQPKGWKETTLGEVAKIITGKTPPTSRPELFGKEYPFITPTDIGSDNIFCSSERHLSKEGAEYQKNLLLPSNTICYTCIASIGKICITKNGGFTNQQINSLIVNNQNDFRFIYYLLKYKTPQILRIAGGTITGIVNKTQFSDFVVSVPALPEQHEIAEVLSSLDDKIELLRKQNETLEVIARVIFHEWFAEFNFPNEQGKPYKATGGKMIESELGEIPEGWSIKEFSETADFLNGLALQKFPPKGKADELPVIKIRELKSGITEQTDKASKGIPEKYVVKDGDILFSWSGSLEVVIWQHGKGALNQHLFKVTSDEYPKWFLYLWLLYHLPFFRSIALNKATTMGHIQRFHLDQAKVLIPTDDVFKKIDLVMSSILEKFMFNNTTIKSFAVVRDALLPKLMSGEVRVKV